MKEQIQKLIMETDKAVGDAFLAIHTTNTGLNKIRILTGLAKVEIRINNCFFKEMCPVCSLGGDRSGAITIEWEHGVMCEDCIEELVPELGKVTETILADIEEPESEADFYKGLDESFQKNVKQSELDFEIDERTARVYYRKS